MRIVTITLLALLLASPLLAHCDTADGPVARDVQRALSTGRAEPVLKWVRPADEPAVRSAFDRTLDVRALGGAAAELADTWLLENVVRIHRAGEGAPYTGIRPSGSEVEPGIARADEALESGQLEALVKELTDRLTRGLQERFEVTRRAAEGADRNVEAGRAWVETYVEFLHYVEGVHEALAGGSHH